MDPKITFTPEELDLIKKTCIPAKANQEHVDLFVYTCQKYGLNPLTKEIVLDIRENKNTHEKKAVIITTRDGYLKASMQDPSYNGVNGGVVKEGDTFELDPIAGILKHSFGTKRGEITAGWAVAKAKGRDTIICIADYGEYSAANSSSYTWQGYPSAMIQKVAEIMAMKRQFNITGLVGIEEIGESVESVNNLIISETEEIIREKPEEINSEKSEETNPIENSAEEPKEEPRENAVFEVVLMGSPRKKNGQEIIGVQAVIASPPENEGEVELLAPIACKEIMTNGAALIIEGILLDGKLEAVSVKPIAGGEGEVKKKEEPEELENVIILLATPKPGTITYKGQIITKPFASCKYPGNYAAVFAAGEALKPFAKGDMLEIVIADEMKKDGKLMLFVKEAQKISSQQQAV